MTTTLDIGIPKKNIEGYPEKGAHQRGVVYQDIGGIGGQGIGGAWVVLGCGWSCWRAGPGHWWAQAGA